VPINRSQQRELNENLWNIIFGSRKSAMSPETPVEDEPGAHKSYRDHEREFENSDNPKDIWVAAKHHTIAPEHQALVDSVKHVLAASASAEAMGNEGPWSGVDAHDISLHKTTQRNMAHLLVKHGVLPSQASYDGPTLSHVGLSDDGMKLRARYSGYHGQGDREFDY